MKLNETQLRKLIIEAIKYGKGDLPKRPKGPSFKHDGPEDFPYSKPGESFLGNDRESRTPGEPVYYDAQYPGSEEISAAINVLIPLSFKYRSAERALEALRVLRKDLAPR
jgi:hypothetical protein